MLIYWELKIEIFSYLVVNHIVLIWIYLGYNLNCNSQIEFLDFIFLDFTFVSIFITVICLKRFAIKMYFSL